MRPKTTTTQRGLGAHHQQNRKRLLMYHIDGSPCWWCGKPMYRDKTKNHDGLPLAADHEHARAKGGQQATRLMHYSCNSARGDGTKDHTRPALKIEVEPTTGTTPFNWGKTNTNKHKRT